MAGLAVGDVALITVAHAVHAFANLEQKLHMLLPRSTAAPLKTARAIAFRFLPRWSNQKPKSRRLRQALMRRNRPESCVRSAGRQWRKTSAVMCTY
jgi:hypothetical protein